MEDIPEIVVPDTTLVPSPVRAACRQLLEFIGTPGARTLTAVRF